jgi:hypothetical protein
MLDIAQAIGAKESPGAGCVQAVEEVFVAAA